MVELSLMASATFAPGIFHQEPGLCRGPPPTKEFQAQVPTHGKRQEMLKFGSTQFIAHQLDGSWHSMNLLPDYYQRASVVPKPVLIDVQDACPDSVHFSFGIAEQCTRHEQAMKFLKSGSNMAEGEGPDISSLTDFMGLHTVAVDVCRQPHVPMDDLCPCDVGMDDSQYFMQSEKQFFSPKPLLDFVGSHSSAITMHPDGRVLFTGSSAEMKDFLSLVAEFYPSHQSTNGGKKSLVVPYFSWSGGARRRANNQGYSSKLQTGTVAHLKSLEKVKLKRHPNRKQNRKPEKERDLYKKNYFHACENLMSAILNKKRDKMAILSLTKSGPEVTELLTRFSAGVAGTGLAVLFSVACKMPGGKAPFPVAKLFNTAFGFGLFWLSWAINSLRDTISHVSKNSSKIKVRDEEVVRKVERSVNEVLFRAMALMAVAVLRLV